MSAGLEIIENSARVLARSLDDLARGGTDEAMAAVRTRMSTAFREIAESGALLDDAVADTARLFGQTPEEFLQGRILERAVDLGVENPEVIYRAANVNGVMRESFEAVEAAATRGADEVVEETVSPAANAADDTVEVLDDTTTAPPRGAPETPPPGGGGPVAAAPRSMLGQAWDFAKNIPGKILGVTAGATLGIGGLLQLSGVPVVEAIASGANKIAINMGLSDDSVQVRHDHLAGFSPEALAERRAAAAAEPTETVRLTQAQMSAAGSEIKVGDSYTTIGSALQHVYNRDGDDRADLDTREASVVTASFQEAITASFPEGGINNAGEFQEFRGEFEEAFRSALTGSEELDSSQIDNIVTSVASFDRGDDVNSLMEQQFDRTF